MELSTVAGVPEDFLLTMAPLAFHSLIQKKRVRAAALAAHCLCQNVDSCLSLYLGKILQTKMNIDTTEETQLLYIRDVI